MLLLKCSLKISEACSPYVYSWPAKITLYTKYVLQQTYSGANPALVPPVPRYDPSGAGTSQIVPEAHLRAYQLVGLMAK